jgi:hypothetical protein
MVEVLCIRTLLGGLVVLTRAPGGEWHLKEVPKDDLPTVKGTFLGRPCDLVFVIESFEITDNTGFARLEPQYMGDIPLIVMDVRRHIVVSGNIWSHQPV